MPTICAQDERTKHGISFAHRFALVHIKFVAVAAVAFAAAIAADLLCARLGGICAWLVMRLCCHRK